MDTENVTIIGKHVKPIPREEIANLEAALGITLPGGYVDFMQAFGEGIYADLFRIYPPERILNEYEERRRWWKDHYYEDTEGNRHWFYKGSEEVLNPDQIQESFIIGDTLDGDNLVFYPPDRDHIYILPRHSDLIVTIDSGFNDLRMLWAEGKPRLHIFQPFHSQEYLRRSSEDYSVTQKIFLAQLHKQWGEDGVLIVSEEADDWSWELIGYILVVGGRFQVIQDEGVTREIVTEHAISTIQGGGRRYLWMDVECDEERVIEINAFLDELEALELVKWKAL